MSHSTSSNDLVALIFERLLEKYGPHLTNADVAEELRVERAVIYNRRSRGKTGGMPSPVPDMHPQQFRAVELARWFAGELNEPTAQPTPLTRRGPGRPRKVAVGAGAVEGGHASARR